MKYIGLLTVVITGLLLIYGVEDFPEWGDPHSPASSHLSTHYINKIEEETHVPNLVTAVLADYRGFDTMLETAVVFVAGIAIFAIMGQTGIPRKEGAKRTRPKATSEEDLIVRTTCRLLFPPIQIFALYVIAHGHYSPGGGFQGGVILAAGFILASLAFRLRTVLHRFSRFQAILLANLGIFIFGGTGLLCLLLGSNFLDYSVLSQVYPGTDEIMARSHSMLVVEIGVGFTVMSILYMIYGNLSSRGDFEEGL